ncbi:hypothetical protein [Microvirga lotononidis]|uniref:Uncharacterized protein n=1 Tax=Microvirga lotononidis TaxID=864069 RepID=I4YU69_9HYPH|nr:hypothetical protein [Microvirga lotononidis]EIM27511.1 hypothetical protein MicloDRAFT_00040790 [Microvirga lotononidis]WQO28337.1 hypothetical protein U0023_04360 [Microvirga lotononidis]
MLKLRMPLSTRAKPGSILALALILPVAAGSVPAHAEGIFAFLQALTQPAAPPPPPAQSFGYQPDQGLERSYQKPRPRPKPVVLEQPEIKKPVEPKPIGEIANPVPALLADSTLRPGDMVMFPDGLRVFTGRPGEAHKLADFKPLAQAGKHLSRETRKLVAHLLPAENIAWNTDAVKSGGMLASNTNDVSTTGSVNRFKSRKDSRSR